MVFDEVNIFEKLSTGSLALISGMAIIATGTFFAYIIYPLLESDPTVFYYTVIGLSLCIAAPLFFYLDEIINFSDILGKFTSGALLAGFAALLFHINQSFDIEGWLYPILHIFLTGLFSFITVFILVRGVIVPIARDRQEKKIPESNKEWDSGETTSSSQTTEEIGRASCRERVYCEV